jgi:hypothetical protein
LALEEKLDIRGCQLGTLRLGGVYKTEVVEGSDICIGERLAGEV